MAKRKAAKRKPAKRKATRRKPAKRKEHSEDRKDAKKPKQDKPQKYATALHKVVEGVIEKWRRRLSVAVGGI